MVNQTPKRKQWPIDPAQYPLNGPSQGAVYTSEQDKYPNVPKEELTYFGKCIVWLLMGVGYGICAFGPWFLLAMCK